MSCAKCQSDVTPAFSTEWRVVNPSSGWDKSELAEGPSNPLTTISLEICGACLRKEKQKVRLSWGVTFVICLAITIICILTHLPILYIASGVCTIFTGLGLATNLFSQDAIPYLEGIAVDHARAIVGGKKNFFMWTPKRGMGFVRVGSNSVSSLAGLNLSGLQAGEHVLDILPLVPWYRSAVLTDRYIRSDLDKQLGGPCSLTRIVAPFVLRLGSSGTKTVGALYTVIGERTTVGWTSDASPECVESFFFTFASILGWSIHVMKGKEGNFIVLLSDTSCVVSANFIGNPKWPQMCCVCENPTIFKTRRFYVEQHSVDPLFKGMVGALEIYVPYCETCYSKVDAGALLGVAILGKTYGEAAIYFKNKNYALSFLSMNGLPFQPQS